MGERMLNKQVMPTMDEMRATCGSNAELFTKLNQWLLSLIHICGGDCLCGRWYRHYECTVCDD